MGVLKFLLKAAALQAFIAVAICKWITLFFSSMTGWILRFLSILIFLTGVITFLMQLSDGRELLGMLAGAFVLFVLPAGLVECARGLAFLQTFLGDFLRS